MPGSSLKEVFPGFKTKPTPEIGFKTPEIPSVSVSPPQSKSDDFVMVNNQGHFHPSIDFPSEYKMNSKFSSDTVTMSDKPEFQVAHSEKIPQPEPIVQSHQDAIDHVLNCSICLKKVLEKSSVLNSREQFIEILAYISIGILIIYTTRKRTR